MRNKSKRLTALLMTLVMCFATLAPAMVVFATEETSSTTPQYIAQETFDGDTLNTSADDAAIKSAGGFWFKMDSGSTYTLENGTLKYLDRAPGDFTGIRLFLDESQKSQLQDDFILSFRIKALAPSISTGELYWKSSSEGEWQSPVYFTSGRLVVNKTRHNDCELVQDKWAVVEIAFHFDETATSVSGLTGAIATYDVFFNGTKVAENQEMPQKIHSLDYYRLFQNAHGEYELDYLAIAVGSSSLAATVGYDDISGRTHFFTEKTAPTGYAYSMALVGDIQTITRYDTASENLAKIYDWILANKDEDKLNIQYVMGLGDITNDNTTDEWDVAYENISKLNGFIPHSVVRGNHDEIRPSQTDDSTMYHDSTRFNEYFNVDEYKKWFNEKGSTGGFYNNKVENSWRTLNIGGTDYLFITLDYGADDDELNWAGGIIESYPNHKVIITTHSYLDINGKVNDANGATPPSGDGGVNDGDDMWDKLIRKYENIFLVISGHVACDQVVTTQVEGDHGNIVTQMLVDFQTVDAHYGATGMVTMLYFSEDGNTIEVETYSTIQQKYFLEENQFVIRLNSEIYFNDFESCTTADIPTTVGGTVVLGAEACGHSVSDGVLNINKTDGAGHISLRVNQGYSAYMDGGVAPIKDDVTLSFKIKLNDHTANLGTLYCSNDTVGFETLALLNINGGEIRGYGKSAALIEDQWNTVAVVLNYDYNNGKFASYTVMLNGEEQHTNAISSDITLNSINRFALSRWSASNVSFAIDDLYYGFGRAVGKTTELWSVDFNDVTQIPVESSSLNGFEVRNNYDPAKNASATTKIENGILSAINGSGQGYVAAYSDAFQKAGNKTLSMRVKPIGTSWNGGMFLNVRHSGDDFNLVQFAAQNQIVVNDKTITLSTERFSTVEVMFHYDYAKLLYTSAEVYVNGVSAGIIDISANNCSQITGFWMFMVYAANNGMAIDDMTVVNGCTSLYKKTEYAGYQTTAADANGYFNLRLVSIMTDMNLTEETLNQYDYVGYNVKVSYKVGETTYDETLNDTNGGRCNKVFTSVMATDEMGGLDNITAESLGGKYIFALNVQGISTAWTNIQFSVTTYYKLANSDEVISDRTVNFTVDPATDVNQGGVN